MLRQSHKRDAYRYFEQIALLIAGFAAIAFAASLLPERAGAFWPFFSDNAAAASLSVTPSSATPILSAPINSNPQASPPATLATSNDSALLPYAGPAGAAANVAGIETTDRISVYVVRKGDTLSDIAGMFGVSVNTILWANGLKSARDVRPGDTLIILPISGVKHVVAKGDSLKSLAKKYGADAEEIAIYNGLDDGEALTVGTTVIVPGGEFSAPAPAAKPKASGLAVKLNLGTTLTFLSDFFSNPLPGGRITQGLHGHNGIDVGAVRGTPIYAAAAGTVIISRNSGWNGGYGKYIVITHANGVQTLYSHNSSNVVSAGESVVQGQLIGYVGNTGKSTGTHLHFEVRGAKNPFTN